jgi:hypothetical protein
MRRLTAIASSAVPVVAATGLIFAQRPVAPALSLGVLYLLAILPVAVLWGSRTRSSSPSRACWP